MNYSNKISLFIRNDLKTFYLFEFIIATFCTTIPFFLWLADEQKGFRGSISKYVDIKRGYVYGMLLTIAAMLFIYNGVVYFNRAEKGFKVGSMGKWYNAILGFSLLMVVAVPYYDNGIIHLIFAIIFYGGNAFVTAFFHNKKFKGYRFLLGILTVASFTYCIWDMNFLFWAEWFSLAIIGIHFIFEGIRMNQMAE